jgi:hypothetical protein
MSTRKGAKVQLSQSAGKNAMKYGSSLDADSIFQDGPENSLPSKPKFNKSVKSPRAAKLKKNESPLNGNFFGRQLLEALPPRPIDRSFSSEVMNR